MVLQAWQICDKVLLSVIDRFDSVNPLLISLNACWDQAVSRQCWYQRTSAALRKTVDILASISSFAWIYHRCSVIMPLLCWLEQSIMNFGLFYYFLPIDPFLCNAFQFLPQLLQIILHSIQSPSLGDHIPQVSWCILSTSPVICCWWEPE